MPVTKILIANCPASAGREASRGSAAVEAVR
jgi:hypothetical protein